MTTPTKPADYRSALREAKRQMQAQKAAGRSSTALVAAASEASIQVRERAAAHAKQAILALWADVNPYDTAAVDKFAARAAKIMSAAQSATARGGAASVTQQLAALGVKVAVKPSAPTDIRAPKIDISNGKVKLIRRTTTVKYDNRPDAKITPADSTTESVFKRPAEVFRAAAARNKDDGPVLLPIGVAQHYVNTSNPDDDDPEVAASAAKYQAGLQKMIQEQGWSAFKNHPVLEVGSDGKHAVLSDGNHRVRAAVAMGLTEVPMMIVTGEDDDWARQYGKPVESHLRKHLNRASADPATLARQRIEKLIDDNLMLAQRLGEQEVIAKAADLDNPTVKVTGYRRVVHPELSRGGSCGMCIVASDRIYKTTELKPIHSNCKCTVAPVTADNDPGNSLNKQDLGQFYKEAGGNSAAHLKRTRYQVDEHGELGAVLVPKKPYKPRSKNSKLLAKGKKLTPPPSETSRRESLTKQIDAMERNLQRLRNKGEPANSAKVAYHNRVIAKFRKELAAL